MVGILCDRKLKSIKSQTLLHGRTKKSELIIEETFAILVISLFMTILLTCYTDESFVKYYSSTQYFYVVATVSFRKV